MTDWGASGRRDEFSFFLVDPFTLEEVGQIECDAKASSLAFDWTGDNIAQAKLVVVGGDYRDNGFERMIRVKQRTVIGDYDETRTRGTYFVSDMSKRSENGLVTRELTCYSALWRQTQDEIAALWSHTTGDNVVEGIRELIEPDGGILRVLDGVDTARTFGSPVWIDPGENRAEMVRMVAGWIGCRIGVDEDGRVTIAPDRAASDKSVKFSFEAGSNCVYVPGIDWTTNRGEIVNRVIAFYSRESKSDDDAFPLSDIVVADLPDAADFSYVRCGRRRTHVVKVSQPVSHEELESTAQRALGEDSGETLLLEIEHADVPGLSVGDVVEYWNSADEEVHALATVQEMDVPSLDNGCMTRTSLKLEAWLA